MHNGKLELIQKVTQRDFHPFQGKVMDISFMLGPRVGDNFKFFHKFDNCWLSPISRIEYEKDYMMLHTRNSVYKLIIEEVDKQ